MKTPVSYLLSRALDDSCLAGSEGGSGGVVQSDVDGLLHGHRLSGASRRGSGDFGISDDRVARMMGLAVAYSRGEDTAEQQRKHKAFDDRRVSGSMGPNGK